MDRSSLVVGRSSFLVIYIRTVLVYLFNLQDTEEIMTIYHTSGIRRCLRSSTSYTYNLPATMASPIIKINTKTLLKSIKR